MKEMKAMQEKSALAIKKLETTKNKPNKQTKTNEIVENSPSK